MLPSAKVPDRKLRVLVVDDEPAITELVSMALRYEGFEPTTASNASEALREAHRTRPDLAILDVMLPDSSGLELCRSLSADGKLPVVFLTARASTEDKIAGLTMGGDDYVTKPFSVEELMARVRAMLRRTRPTTDAAVSRCGDLVLDEDAHEVRRGDQVIELTPTEFTLLRYLMLNAGRVLSKAQILDHVWHYDFGGNDNIVEAYISYIRKKVDAVTPPLIHTVRGVGYTLRVPR